MPIPTTYTSDFGGPKIRKGENRGKGVKSLTPGLCRAATCLREAKIRKGESIDKQKELAPSQLCRAASCFSETRIVQSPRNVQVPAGRHRMKHLKTYGPAGKSIVCHTQNHCMPSAKTSYATGEDILCHHTAARPDTDGKWHDNKNVFNRSHDSLQ